jgi:RNA-binding protein
MTTQAQLTPAARKALKARAHRLAPVVWIGGDGLSASLLAEIERALAAHELIKVRAASLGREAREHAMALICASCAAQPVQHIGKVLVIYREKPKDANTGRGPAAGAPKPRSKGPAGAGRGKRTASRRRA